MVPLMILLAPRVVIAFVFFIHTAVAHPSWQYEAYQDEDCATLALQDAGTAFQDCQATGGQQLLSYRFASTTDPSTNLTFGFRAYNGRDCLYLSVIDDGKGDGSCQKLSFESINIFEYEE
ncbi:hypothetical protein QBC44DRAFT_357472 [Cladorrhinum sp. PSN332]|nr:hypothetical protein QBC44DRAFT_357472 [Cladorrhinum sp. PSN332]